MGIYKVAFFAKNKNKKKISNILLLLLLLFISLNYEKSESNIKKNLDQLHEGIKLLEQQLSSEEQSGAS